MYLIIIGSLLISIPFIGALYFGDKEGGLLKAIFIFICVVILAMMIMFGVLLLGAGLSQ